MEREGRRREEHDGLGDSADRGPYPGKRTRVEARYPAQLQLKRVEARTDSAVSAEPAAAFDDPFALHLPEGGAPLPAHLRDQLEQRSGADLSAVRVHTGAASAAAAESLDARAFALGQDIHFADGAYNPGSPEGEHLIIHEVAHTIQQGPSAPTIQRVAAFDLGDSSDPAEAEADRFADAVMGDAAEIPTLSSVGAGAQPTIRRWGGKEHKTLGDRGGAGIVHDRFSMSFGIENGKPKSGAYTLALTHGDIVMLTGDYFCAEEYRGRNGDTPRSGPYVDPHDSLPYLLGRPSTDPGSQVGTQDEILYALQHANPGDPRFWWGGEFGPIAFSTQVKESVVRRYRKLAVDNVEHFARPHDERGDQAPPVNGGKGHSGGSSYRALHEDAIQCAFDAGGTGRAIDDALLFEAMGQHYLTDAFSAGHVRTPRASIMDFWNKKYPDFHQRFMTWAVNQITAMTGAFSPLTESARALAGPLAAERVVELMRSDVVAMFKQKCAGLKVSFGHIVSLCAHDVDNEMGVDVTNDLGDRWHAYGDGKLLSSDPASQKFATTAVRLGIEDVRHAYELGRRGATLDSNELFAQVRAMSSAPAKPALPRYAPEQVVPRLAPAEESRQTWAAQSIEALWGHFIRSDQLELTWGERIAHEMKSGAIGRELEDAAESTESFAWATIMERKIVPVALPRVALKLGLVTPLAENTYETLLRILATDPQ